MVCQSFIDLWYLTPQRWRADDAKKKEEAEMLLKQVALELTHEPSRMM